MGCILLLLMLELLLKLLLLVGLWSLNDARIVVKVIAIGWVMVIEAEVIVQVIIGAKCSTTKVVVAVTKSVHIVQVFEVLFVEVAV